MHLKEILIDGFKSFADRTRLELSSGVTAIVGPNGCGKSNIVDAIRWVLGEQSAKALRGSSMQDVIFEGTDKRKPLHLCEVSLTFADCEAELGTAFNEVRIARRVTRDSGSEYSINGKTCRLRDIQRLFANTGVGRVSYSFMVQGQIDQILSTNPAERRVIFEEAAGITLYKAQRKEALNKLALVDGNLARVTDVIEEVSRQIGSLKRQAGKALRYQRLHHRLTHLDLAHGAHRHTALQRSIDEAGARATALRRDLDERNASLDRDEAALTEKKTARNTLFEAMQERQQQVYNLRSEKENAETQAGFADIRREELDQRIVGFRAEVEDLAAQKSALARRAESEAESKQMQLGVVDDSDRIFRDRSAELVAAQEQLGELEAELQERRQAVIQAENSLNRARSRCTTLEVDLRTYQVKHGDLKDGLATLRQQDVDLAAGMEEIRRSLAKAKEAESACAAEAESAAAACRAILDRFRKLQEDIQGRDREIARTTARLALLEDLQAKFEGFGEGAKAILEGKLDGVLSKDEVAILSRSLKVPEAYGAALEALLGPAAEALFVGPADTALGAVDRLNQEGLGRACLQVALAPGEAPTAGELPEDIVAADAVVESAEERLRLPLRHLLAGCYFADDLRAAVAFREARPDAAVSFIATREGDLLDSRGLIYGGRATGRPATGVLEREREIRRLRARIEDEREAMENLREQAAVAETERETAEARLEETRRRAGELAAEVSGLAAEERGQEQKRAATTESLSRTEAELAGLEDRHADSLTAMDEAKAALEAAEGALQTSRKAVDEIEAALAAAREARDAKREALADVRLELAEKKQRLETFDRALGEVERETAELHNRILRRQQEIDAAGEQIAELARQAEEERARAAGMEESLAVLTERLEADRAELRGIDAGIAEIDGGLSGRRTESRTLEQEHARLEVRLAEERSQRGFLESRVRDEYQRDLAGVDWKHALLEAGTEFEKRLRLDDLDDPDAITARPKSPPREPTAEELAALDGTDWDAVEAEIAELRGRVTSMGPVNLDAISEYADLKERYDFLKNQSDDLWKAKEALVKSIDEINETSQTLFRDTFEQIKRNFAFTYSKLSGGGESGLELVDSGDPLESGIEIIARPPGTRLKNVTLLSGGQRTMAAVALLFAIYLVKPSPVCVLDEIDAALDDANIGRFCETLHGFTGNSQFLIVTHNKRTISNANTVFGITMPEKGVSTLVSMRFHKDAHQTETAGV